MVCFVTGMLKCLKKEQMFPVISLGFVFEIVKICLLKIVTLAYSKNVQIYSCLTFCVYIYLYITPGLDS